MRREFASLDVTDDKLSVNLFRRHQKESEAILPLEDIKQCQILIGDMVITTINTTITHGFNDPTEQALREIFHNEQVAKMVDGKVRRISLTLNTDEKDKYVICLYLRKGSDRITKASYFEVVENAIDWCWFFAKHINSEQTGKRIVKPKLTAEEIAKAEHKAHDNSPLHAQAANSRPTANQLNQAKTSVEADAPEIDVKTAQCEEGNSEKTIINAEKTDTHLVYDLEKIVELHQEGFLTAEEFLQAKAQLLDSLDDSKNDDSKNNAD